MDDVSVSAAASAPVSARCAPPEHLVGLMLRLITVYSSCYYLCRIEVTLDVIFIKVYFSSYQ